MIVIINNLFIELRLKINDKLSVKFPAAIGGRGRTECEDEDVLGIWTKFDVGTVARSIGDVESMTRQARPCRRARSLTWRQNKILFNFISFSNDCLVIIK